jgi:hypothetical protein
MTEGQRWLFDRLSLLYRRGHGLPEPVARPPYSLSIDDDPPPDSVAEISRPIARVLQFLALADVRPEPKESLAEALARALFDDAGNPNELGRAFFGWGEQGGACAP